MPRLRINVRKIREILRLDLESGRSIRQISASTKTSVGAIQKLLKQARMDDLSWPLPAELDDVQLAELVLPESQHTENQSLHCAGLDTGTSGTQTKSDDQALVMGGVLPNLPKQLLQLLTVLRPLYAVEQATTTLYAAITQGR